MSIMSLTQIEKSISVLPREDQLFLPARIIHRLRKKKVTEEIDIDSQVAAMAEDKEIRMELEKINQEFVVTELDGLGKF